MWVMESSHNCQAKVEGISLKANKPIIKGAYVCLIWLLILSLLN